MKVKTVLIIVGFVLSLVGCAGWGGEGSAFGNLSHPTRKDFTIHGITVAVVRLSIPNVWVSFYVDGTFPPLPIIKEAQIAAIEQYSGCKVSSAEFNPGSLQPAYLEAVVKC